MARLLPRQIFLAGNRRPTVVFFTSSRAKFVQAQLVFESAGLNLSHRSNEERPYHESYSGTKEDLLAAAIKELRKRGGVSGSYFFIEDTSIRIEALSGHEDYPGLEAKEWFERTSFEEVDRAVSESGDRRAVIRSCIALAVPTLTRPLYFYGETEGTIAPKPAEFDPDPLLPWLSPNNFSAWFIPNGTSQTLSRNVF